MPYCFEIENPLPAPALMRYPSLEETLPKVLTTTYQIPDDEANRITEHAAKEYV